MRLEDFDYPLPERLIAKEPSPCRDESRLLVIKPDGSREHRRFRDLPDYLVSGDILLLNKTKVMPVSITGTKPTGGKIEMLLVRNIEGEGNRWEVLSRGRYSGPLVISERLQILLHDGCLAELQYEGELREILWADGEMPIPPYLKRKPGALDKERYQTVYAEREGSIAAPTAGLHFTDNLLARISAKGVRVRYLTLHVGRGTFMPIRSELIREHVMEHEEFEITQTLIDEIASRTSRLITVGTTTTRAIEGLLSGRHRQITRDNGTVRSSTDIFITPGHGFRAADCLITNFHLPRSTPLMLASAMAGRERILAAYGEAVNMGYRFYSYGDAMIVLTK